MLHQQIQKWADQVLNGRPIEDLASEILHFVRDNPFPDATTGTAQSVFNYLIWIMTKLMTKVDDPKFRDLACRALCIITEIPGGVELIRKMMFFAEHAGAVAEMLIKLEPVNDEEAEFINDLIKVFAKEGVIKVH